MVDHVSVSCAPYPKVDATTSIRHCEVFWVESGKATVAAELVCGGCVGDDRPSDRTCKVWEEEQLWVLGLLVKLVLQEPHGLGVRGSTCVNLYSPL